MSSGGIEKGSIASDEKKVSNNSILGGFMKKRYGALLLGLVISMGGALQAADLGADVNAVDMYRWTPIVHAASNGDANKVQSLIDAGADVNHVDDFGLTALMEAAKIGNRDIVIMLLGAGADRSQKNSNGETAADIARDRHHVFIETLIRDYVDTFGKKTKAAAKR